jgi:hypothetical protein
VWIIWLGTLVLIAGEALRPGYFRSGFAWGIMNPAGIDALEPYVESMSIAGRALLYTCAAVALASLGLRLFRAQSEERQQIKWICLAIAVVAVSGTPYFLGGPGNIWTEFLIVLALNALPVAIAIAVLKYRLYRDDYVINRGFVFVTLSAILAGIYMGAVQLSRLMFEQASGVQTQASLVGTTLVFGAVFFPLKNRVQGIVDKYYGPATSRIPLDPKEFRSLVQQIEVHKDARDFLLESVRALGATGGNVYLYEQGVLSFEDTVDEPADVETGTRVPLRNGNEEVGYLLLGPRADLEAYAESDLTALQSSADRVGRAIARRGSLLAPDAVRQSTTPRAP